MLPRRLEVRQLIVEVPVSMMRLADPRKCASGQKLAKFLCSRVERRDVPRSRRRCRVALLEIGGRDFWWPVNRAALDGERAFRQSAEPPSCDRVVASQGLDLLRVKCLALRQNTLVPPIQGDAQQAAQEDFPAAIFDLVSQSREIGVIPHACFAHV